jgi:hypothetical protein
MAQLITNVQPAFQKTLALSFAVVAAAMLCSCGGGSSTSPTPSTDSVDQFLSPNLSPAEKAIMRPILASLRPEDRGPTIYFAADGAIHATDAALITQAFWYQPTGVENVYAEPSGETVVFPSMESDATSAASTGPFYREWAPPGYSFFSSSVYVDCANTMITKKSATGLEQDAFIYSGGVSGYNVGVDAGIQINPPPASEGLGSPTSVQGFIRSPNVKPVGSNFYLPCNAASTFSFYPTKTNQVTVKFAGQPGLVLDLASASGWSAGCSCTLKRLTSLAVSPASSVPWVVGSYFGVKNPYTKPTPTIQWTQTVLAKTSSSTNVPWTTASSDSGSIVGTMLLTSTSTGSLTVGINETKQITLK